MILKHDNSLLSEKKIESSLKELKGYLAYIQDIHQSKNYTFPESSINLPFDDAAKDEVLRLAEKKKTSDLKYILVIGIGGSNLGAKAVYDALRGYFDPLCLGTYPKILFLDTADPTFLKAVAKFLSEEIKSQNEIIVNAVSKSGETTETIFNLEGVAEILKKRFGDFVSRLVITTKEGSHLHKKAIAMGVDVLTLPESVPGRFSVFSPAGLFPLALAGFDIESLLKGARETVEENLLVAPENQAAFKAAFLFHHYDKGRKISDFFTFSPNLESLGKWYRQLVAESTGEEKKTVLGVKRIGITPTVSVGSTDLHSMGQLYLSGPMERTTTFVYASKSNVDFKWVTGNIFAEKEHVLPDKPRDLMKAIFGGTKETYRKKGLPFLEIDLEEINENSLGRFMQFNMIQIMLLGKLLKINPFDQPNVESYKKETRCLLEKKTRPPKAL